ncbi:MAG: hypothetical protein BWK76_07560 [Desulfobulbaceae bacterium A2]|nr:MAG: hypothetical protein BWK76_07560 [Desulfobulbaceae bacterium A2]
MYDMQRRLPRIAQWPLALLILIALPAVSLGAEVLDRVVAVVNSDVITLSEVNEAAKPLYKRLSERIAPAELGQAMEQARETVINGLIENKLLEQKAAEKKISISDEEVEVALSRLLERNATSQVQFQSQLAEVGITPAQYRENLKGQIMRSRVLTMEVQSKIIIPEERIIDYFDTHYTSRMRGGGAYLLQIGVVWKVTAGDSDVSRRLAQEEARKKAEKLRDMAAQGQDFKDLARKNSDLPSAADGGDLGAFKTEEMAPYMQEAVKGLKPNEISKVVLTPSGYQFFQMLSTQEGQIVAKAPYESVKEEIREQLFEQEMKARYEQWMGKVREQAYIKVL